MVAKKTKLDSLEALRSAAVTLKQIITIVVAIAITNGMFVVFTNGEYISIKSFEKLLWTKAVILYFILILNIVRYYHGNIRCLDHMYLNRLKDRKAGRIEIKGTHVAVDFFSIFISTLLYAALSFYTIKAREFFALLTFLLLLDVIGLWAMKNHPGGDELTNYRKIWILNNLTTFFVLLACTFLFITLGNHWGSSFKTTIYWVMVGSIAGNTIFDLVVGWKFYFPSLKVNPS